MTTYLISQLARHTRVPATTLRYYESTGLLPAERSPGGYRLYGEPAVERLTFIGTAKRLGLALEEIGELLHVWETGACVQVKSELRPRLRARLDEAERRRDDAAGFVGVLQGALAHLESLPDRTSRCDPNCGFLGLPDGPDAGTYRDAPVACSLTADDVGDRAVQWHSALTDAVREPVTGGLRLTVPVERLTAVAELAAAEHACCPFFDIRLHLEGPRLHLQVLAPAEGQEMLAALFDPPAA